MFTKAFDTYACVGDTIKCESSGFTAIATIYRDNDSKPDSESASQHAVESWNNDEWFYCGIAVTVSVHGVRLTGQYDFALWGIECNFPGSDNTYLRDVANELLPEAIKGAHDTLARLCSAQVVADYF